MLYVLGPSVMKSRGRNTLSPSYDTKNDKPISENVLIDQSGILELQVTIKLY